MTERLITLHSEVLMGMTGTVDYDNHQINGVSIITSNVDAEGHDLHVDDTTVDQLFKLAKKMIKVPVLLDHGAGINSMNGYLHDFRLDDGKLRADWQLLETHEETPKMLERADKMPECFGLSAAFKGKGVKFNGKNAARAEKLISVDCVTRPAANLGLFSAKDETVDTHEIDMAKTNTHTQSEEPTLADVLKALEGFKSEVGERFGQLEQANQPPYTEIDLLRDLYNASDEELARWNEENSQNVTRDEINGTVADYNASIEAGESGETEGDIDGAQATPGDGTAHAEGAAAAPAGVSTAAAGPVGAQLSALQRQVVELRAKFQQKEQIELQAQEELRIDQVNGKIDILFNQREAAIELAEKLSAKCDALEKHLATGTRPLRTNGSQIRLLSSKDGGELHEFQQKVKDYATEHKCSEGKALQFVSHEHPELHADWLQTLSL